MIAVWNICWDTHAKVYRRLIQKLRYPPLKTEKMFPEAGGERCYMPDDPWARAVTLNLANNTSSKHMKSLINSYVDDIRWKWILETISCWLYVHHLENKIALYWIVVHTPYTHHDNINQVLITAFKQLQAIDHNLAIEAHSWNQCEWDVSRFCSCGAVQTKLHVLESCPFTHDLLFRLKWLIMMVSFLLKG